MAGQAGRLRALHIEAGLRIGPSLGKPPGEQPCDGPVPGRIGKAGACRQGAVRPCLRNQGTSGASARSSHIRSVAKSSSPTVVNIETA